MDVVAFSVMSITKDSLWIRLADDLYHSENRGPFGDGLNRTTEEHLSVWVVFNLWVPDLDEARTQNKKHVKGSDYDHSWDVEYH